MSISGNPPPRDLSSFSPPPEESADENKIGPKKSFPLLQWLNPNSFSGSIKPILQCRFLWTKIIKDDRTSSPPALKSFRCKQEPETVFGITIGVGGMLSQTNLTEHKFTRQQAAVKGLKGRVSLKLPSKLRSLVVELSNNSPGRSFRASQL